MMVLPGDVILLSWKHHPLLSFHAAIWLTRHSLLLCGSLTSLMYGAASIPGGADMWPIIGPTADISNAYLDGLGHQHSRSHTRQQELLPAMTG